MLRLIHVFALIVVGLSLGTCSQDVELSPDTLEYFEVHLKKDMSETMLWRVFGRPEMDLGHGIHIYVYVLADSTEVWIGCTDTVLYADHFTKNHNHLKILI